VRRAGEEGLFDLLMEKNVAAIQKAGHKRLLTSDPHTYQALKKRVPMDERARRASRTPWNCSTS